MKKMLMITNLPVWSISKGVGAPSFYKTIEVYNDTGWKVDFWTTEKNPDIKELTNVNIKHIPVIIPLLKIPKIYSLLRNMRFVLNQFLIVLFFMLNRKKYDVIYTYEVEFVPGAKLISKIYRVPLVSRFQGTILYPLMKRRFWKIRYLAHFWAISIKSDLTIMTDDGTQGDKVIRILRDNNMEKTWFIRNGVDKHSINLSNVSSKIKDIVKQNKGKKLFLSISRLQQWKRVDRSIDIFNTVQKEYTRCYYLVGGDGAKKKDWESYSNSLGLSDKIIFLGGINKDEVYYLQQTASFFLSTYELSNMGNPLFEAMSNGCIVVTVNNGTTSNLIKDMNNGIISNESEYIKNAEKIVSVLNNEYLFNNIRQNTIKTFKKEFFTWKERMNVEYDTVLEILTTNNTNPPMV